MKVSKGLATYAGLVAALGQYAAAVAVFLEADNQSDALGPLVTATVTLLAVVVGRMRQATALAKPAPLVDRDLGRWSGLTSVSSPSLPTSQQVMAMAGGLPPKGGKTRALGEPTDLSLEIPGGGFPQDGERP